MVRVAWCGVDIAPSAVTPELAAAALASPALSSALRLAEWVGDGKELTASGMLRPAGGAEACRALGIDLPAGKPRSTGDVPQLMHSWEVAHDAGLISVAGKYAYGPGFVDVTADPGAALRSWLRAVAAKFGVPDDPCGECLTVLAALAAAEGAVGAVEMMDAVRAAFPAPEDDDGPDDRAQHAVLAVAYLLSFDAATPAGDGPDDDTVRLTPLGRMLAESVFAVLAPDPAADAGTVVTGLAELPPMVANVIGQPWLAARTPAGAARELLGFAESAAPETRLVAMAIAREIGPEAAEAWRERARVPGFGAYARSWLVDYGEEVEQDPRDEAWLAVESLSAGTAMMRPQVASLMIAAAMGESSGREIAEMVTAFKYSGHPDAVYINQAIAMMMVSPEPPRPRAVPTRAKSWPALAPGNGAYQLKITLREVSGPSVWRRVLVPADTLLDTLAAIIELAMGWDGLHQHMFSDRRREYADSKTLRDLLSKPGDQVCYTYDFGDDWEHDIDLEDIVPNDLGAPLPACLDGSGACPPEDCGGRWGYQELKEILADPAHEEHEEMLDWLGLESGDDFDPATFSVDEANRRLSQLQVVPDVPPGDAIAARPAPKVVRLQRRVKKTKAKRRR